MLDWWLRYEPVVALARDVRPRLVLDVGSGWHGLSWFWPGEVVNTDLAFAAEARPDEGGRAGRASYVTSSVERLPFPDDAFDLVVCLDLLEHVPVALRTEAVRELARVGRRLVVGFPSGATALGTDQRTARLFDLARISHPTWLQEHLAIADHPEPGWIVDQLPAGAVVEQRRSNTNRWVHLGLILAEHQRWTGPAVERLSHRATGRRLPALLHRGRPYRHVIVVRTS